MEIKYFLIIFTQFNIVLIECHDDDKKDDKTALKEPVVSSWRGNPDFVRDRHRNNKPEMPPSWKNRFRQIYDPAWMDYCDPYHCNDYHRLVCGLNRRNMKFKWFQSTCHLIINNQCAEFRGFLKYDMIENKFCHAYVMFLRAGCPRIDDCQEEIEPVCAMSSIDGHIVLFRNQCCMDAFNCRNSTIQEYESVYMFTCKTPLLASRTENEKLIMNLIENL